MSATLTSENFNTHNDYEAFLQNKKIKEKITERYGLFPDSFLPFTESRAVIETGVISHDIHFCDSRDKKIIITKMLALVS